MGTRVIKLADDKEYTLSILTIKDLIDVEKKFGSTEIDNTKLENIIYWVWLSLRRNHKDLTLEALEDLITMPFVSDGRLNEIFLMMSQLNGWDKLPKNAQSPVEKK